LQIRRTLFRTQSRQCGPPVSVAKMKVSRLLPFRLLQKQRAKHLRNLDSAVPFLRFCLLDPKDATLIIQVTHDPLGDLLGAQTDKPGHERGQGPIIASLGELHRL